jgi:glutamine synthetase
MNELREVVDELETVVPSDIWPYPTYGEILYSVK